MTDYILDDKNKNFDDKYLEKLTRSNNRYELEMCFQIPVNEIENFFTKETTQSRKYEKESEIKVNGETLKIKNTVTEEITIADQIMKNPTNKRNFSLVDMIQCGDFVALWKKFKMGDNTDVQNKMDTKNQNDENKDDASKPLDTVLENLTSQYGNFSYNEVINTVQSFVLTGDEQKFIYCNVIPKINKIINEAYGSENSKLNRLKFGLELCLDNKINVDDLMLNFLDESQNRDNQQLKFVLCLYKDKKINSDDLISSYLNYNPANLPEKTMNKTDEKKIIETENRELEISQLDKVANDSNKNEKQKTPRTTHIKNLKFGLELYRNKKITLDELIFNFLDKEHSIGSTEKVNFADVCGQAVEILKNDNMISDKQINDFKRQIKNAADVSVLGTIWQAIVNFFKGSVVEEKMDNVAKIKTNKPLQKISTWQRLRQDRAINNIKKPLSQILKLNETRRTQNDRL